MKRYGRVLLKLSGEALSGGGANLDFDKLKSVCEVIKSCMLGGTQTGIVVGGGNIWRGARNGAKLQRTRADHMGMLATGINALALADVLESLEVPARVQTALEMGRAAEPYSRDRAVRHLEKGRAVIFAGGTGNPYFSTDTAAVLRGKEIQANVILLAKNIDGVYSADPKKDPDAVKYTDLTFEEVIDRKLTVIDLTAASLSIDEQRTPLYVFSLDDPDNIRRAVMGEHIGTIVK